MDEDVAGLTRVLAGGAHGKCARCGIANRRPRRAPQRPRQGGGLDLLCERCYRAVVRDGQPVETPEEE